MAIKFSKTFLLRKLHQLTGIVPLGLFFVVHMFTNAKAMNGEASFVKAVKEIHDIPFLLLIEIFGIFLPLLFHSVYGVIISSEAKTNVLQYNFARNWFYFFQRATGIFLFIFILFHLLHFRFGLIPGLTQTAVAGNAGASFNIVAGDFQITWVLVFYILGVMATAWHLAYGIFLFAVDWGIVIGEKAQRATLTLCAGIAVLLSVVGVNAAISFVRPCGLVPKIMCENPKKASGATPSTKL